MLLQDLFSFDSENNSVLIFELSFLIFQRRLEVFLRKDRKPITFYRKVGRVIEDDKVMLLPNDVISLLTVFFHCKQYNEAHCPIFRFNRTRVIVFVHVNYPKAVSHNNYLPATIAIYEELNELMNKHARQLRFTLFGFLSRSYKIRLNNVN